MKLAIFVVLALSLVLTNGASVDPIEMSITTMEGYVESLNEKAEQVAKEVEHKYDEIIVQPIERLEASVHAIEERKEESEECVQRYETDVEIIVQSMTTTLDSCTQTATVESSAVAVDLAVQSTEVAYDSLNLVKGVQKCRRYNNSILKNSCYAKQLVNAKRLLTKTKRTVKNINQSVDETLPQILVELEQCSVVAEELAIVELEAINRNIDNCVAVLL